MALGITYIVLRGTPLRVKTPVTGSFGGPMFTAFQDQFGEIHTTQQWQPTVLNFELVFHAGLEPLDFMSIREEPCQLIMDIGGGAQQIYVIDKVTVTGEIQFSGGEDGTFSGTLTGGIPTKL